MWLAGATDPRPWVTALPVFADLAADPVVTDEMLAAVESEVTPADRMVIVQTSGTTAAPKAIIHTHAAQVRQAWKLAQLYGLTPDTRVFSTMPFFWMGGLTVLLLAHLHAGAAIITVERTDGAAMLDLIETARPTRLLGWTVLERLQADPSFAGRDLGWIDELEVPPVADGRRHGSLGMSETSGPHTLLPDAREPRRPPGSSTGARSARRSPAWSTGSSTPTPARRWPTERRARSSCAART